VALILELDAHDPYPGVMINYIVILVAALCLAGVLGWLPATWLQPFRSAELRLLYLASTRGPSGIDDGVQMQIVDHQQRYSAPLMRMLESAAPGSSAEQVGLYFIELVRGPAEVDTFLAGYAARHPDPKVREFLQDVLNSPTPRAVLARRKR
jgi:hypothetical protein